MNNKNTEKILLLAYYFPNWHVDRLNETVHGAGWTEWEVLKCARSRFPGHYQPRIPVWGYEDESNPEVMARKVRTAAEYGVSGFIFDYYWNTDGPFRSRALDEGFLGCPEAEDFPFALMWCNHSRLNLHPAPFTMYVEGYSTPLVSPEMFDRMTDVWVDRYFTRKNYLRIGEKVYFSVYRPYDLIRCFGSVDRTAEALAKFRDKAKERAGSDIFLHVNYCGLKELQARLLGERTPPENDPLKGYFHTWEECARQLHFDAVGAYAWPEHTTHFQDFPLINGEVVRRDALRFWEDDPTICGLPNHPLVFTGWDPSPRTVQSDMYTQHAYPWTGIMEQTPEEFGDMLRKAVKLVSAREGAEKRIIAIGSWNEWTEGSYLEPDEKYGYGFLEQIRQTVSAMAD